jgi:hypothetical protein
VHILHLSLSQRPQKVDLLCRVPASGKVQLECKVQVQIGEIKYDVSLFIYAYFRM